jgi:hypothetical protein
MDATFVLIIIALYAVTRWLVSTFARLGGVE